MQLAMHMVTIEDLMPQGHFLRKLEAALDLSFVYEETAPNRDAFFDGFRPLSHACSLPILPYYGYNHDMVFSKYHI